MEIKGQLKGCAVDMITGMAQITFVTKLTTEITDFASTHDKGKDLRIKVAEWRDKRSLKANGYFHKLCELLATARTLTGDVVKPYQVKNEMLAAYGQRLYMDNGKAWVIKTQITLDEAMNLQNDMHLEFWRTDPNEENVYWYYVKRGSHTYDTREMAALIEGTIYECKQYNVETLPPEEIERMVRAWQPESA